MINSSNKGDEVEQDGIVLKSKFMTDAKGIIPILNEVSPSLCLAKWKQVSLHLTNGLNNSCYHPPLHAIDTVEISKNPSALHNTRHKKEIRRMMKEGVRPGECNYCWAIEDAGNLSDRHYRSAEPWAFKDFQEIVDSDWDADIIPSYVEVNFSNVCNLKCSYCSPQFSSSWNQEILQHGSFPTNPPHNDLKYLSGDHRVLLNREHNPYVEAFWKWWPDLYPELKHFRMTGGEPLMDPNTYRVFDYVLANPKADLHLDVTSNFSQEEKVFNKYMDYVKRLCTGEQVEHFMQYVSIDSWGKQAEYIRHGLNFDLMWSNVDRYLSEIPYRNSLTFIITMNNLVTGGLQKLLEEILALRKIYSDTYQRIWFDTPYLRKPEWQSLQLLPPSYAAKMQSIVTYMEANLETENTRFHGFKDYEVQRMQRVVDWMKEGKSMPAAEAATQHMNFYKFFNEHDKRRNTDFKTTFPEMKEFWAIGEYYAKRT